MANSQSWSGRLLDYCRMRGVADPFYQHVSDRRGGRTAWSSIVSVNGVPYAARFWYDGNYMESAREDAAEIALKAVSGLAGLQQPQMMTSRGTQAGTGHAATA
ncbi:hypothetical protein ACN47E_006887 [Coniothyrium glycines]